MENFKEELIMLINSQIQRLSFEQVFYVVKDTYRDLYENYQKYLLNQTKQQNLINQEQTIKEEEIQEPIEENKEEEK